MCNTQFKAKSSAYKASLKYIISNPQTSHINMQHIILYNIARVRRKLVETHSCVSASKIAG